MSAKGGPIWIPCIGSGAVGHHVGGNLKAAMCPMCGTTVPVVYDSGCDHHLVIGQHDRDDILARIARGDFDD